MATSRAILVTGGTGNIGSALVKRLIESGSKVRVLTLSDDPLKYRLENTGVEIFYGDVSNKESLSGICTGIDTVLHLAAVLLSNDVSVFDRVNIMGTQNILQAARQNNVRHFIHVSSASVVYPRTTPYSLSKRVAERLVKESGVPWTIVRPTLVYSEDGSLEFNMFLDYLLKFPIIPFIGAGQALKRPVYVDDLIDAFVKLAAIPDGTGKIYNFSGKNAISMIDFARLCLLLSGYENKPILIIPEWICIIAARLMKKYMKNPVLKWNMIAGVVQDADLDPSDTINDLGYAPHDLVDQLRKCFPRKGK